MNLELKKLWIFLFIPFAVATMKSQGCSDAGFCTIGALKHNRDTLSNQLTVGFTYGKGDNKVNVYTPFLGYRKSFSEKFGIDSKITYQSTDGDLGSASGFGDLYLSGIYSIPMKDNKLSFTGGIKIPLSNPDKQGDGAFSLPLPMEYQPSLGTFDLILGATYELKHWNFSLGYQQPLSQNDKGYWGDYIRKSDGLAKISYNWLIKDKFSITPSTLIIYHFGDDEVEFNQIKYSIDGSSGITWNGAIDFGYQINAKNGIGLMLATPFAVRDTRPDGLTRKFVGTISYKFNF